MSQRLLSSCALLALVGCGGNFQDYYGSGIGPQIASLDPDFEAGNVGGELVTISGGGFGDNPDEVVVLMDNHNAEIVSVTNNEIVVRTPPGPITGGGVEVLVATPDGYDLRTPSGDVAAYRYGQSVFDEEGAPLRQSPFYRDQRHFIQVSNLYDSCYGGRGVPGCGGNSFNGAVGIDGRGEFFRFSYPRLHTTALGWLTAYDASPGEWNVGPPRSVFPSGIDELRQRGIDRVELANPDNEGAEICVDLTQDLEFATETCDGSFGQRAYDLGVLDFCEEQDQVEGGTGRFLADWPVNRDFFESLPGEGVDVQLRVFADPEAPPEQQLQLIEDLSLPPKVDFDAEYGFDVPAGNPWSVGTPVDCPDSNEDGQVTLDEDGIILSWTPIPAGGTGDAQTNSFIHVSFTYVDFSWYSLEQVGMRASIVVPDNHEVGEDGFARLRIPNEVLYQIPDPNLQWSGETPQSAFLGRYSSNPSYLFMEAYRVTDYRLEGGNGPLIFSYATGELTILAEYSNPLFREDDCEDCFDADEDGWTDDRDPDCNRDVGGNGDNETGDTFGQYTCNDGIDNNGDGLIDAEDPLCENGWDGESTCSDGLDNDEDGWTDDVDPDCDPEIGTGEEDGGVVGGGCNDGLDNDGDGWLDAQDPGCTSPEADEDDGFLGTACNDGVDNDLHGDIDNEDLYCILNGPEADSEQPAAFRTACANGRDDDGDSYIDAFDPDCEVGGASRENASSFDPEDPDVVLVPGCYDGIDNDGDGLRDSEDPGCWNPLLDFQPDGFLPSEATDHGTTCSDGVDSDGDGWVDSDDPDCQPGVPDSQEEVGLGTTECNDGIDNDGDGNIDRDDSRCTSGAVNSEG